MNISLGQIGKVQTPLIRKIYNILFVIATIVELLLLNVIFLLSTKYPFVVLLLRVVFSIFESDLWRMTHIRRRFWIKLTPVALQDNMLITLEDSQPHQWLWLCYQIVSVTLVHILNHSVLSIQIRSEVVTLIVVKKKNIQFKQSITSPSNIV